MHRVVESLLQRPLSHKVGIWGLSIALIFGGFWQFSLSDKFTEREELNDKIVTLDSNIITERRLANNLPKAREKLKDLEARLAEAVGQLPDSSEIDNLLERISNLARESGLELNLFKRNDENFRDFYAEVPVSVSVTGAFHQVATFFDEVGRQPRIVNINQIQLFDPKVEEANMIVKVECVLTAFRYLSEEERAARAPTEKKKRRK